MWFIFNKVVNKYLLSYSITQLLDEFYRHSLNKNLLQHNNNKHKKLPTVI